MYVRTILMNIPCTSSGTLMDVWWTTRGWLCSIWVLVCSILLVRSWASANKFPRICPSSLYILSCSVKAEPIHNEKLQSAFDIEMFDLILYPLLINDVKFNKVVYADFFVRWLIFGWDSIFAPGGTHFNHHCKQKFFFCSYVLSGFVLTYVDTT